MKFIYIHLGTLKIERQEGSKVQWVNLQIRTARSDMQMIQANVHDHTHFVVALQSGRGPYIN